MLKDSESGRFYNYFLIWIIVIVNSFFRISIIFIFLLRISIINFFFRVFIIGWIAIGLLLLLIINLSW